MPGLYALWVRGAAREQLMIDPLCCAERLPAAIGQVPFAVHVTGDGVCGPFLTALPPMDFLLGCQVSRGLTWAAGSLSLPTLGWGPKLCPREL